MRPDSRAVHAGWEPGPRDPQAPPIYQAAVYVYDDLDDYDAVAGGQAAGHVYSRNSNQNVAMLEAGVAGLEGADAAVATSSGMAALYLTVLGLAPSAAPVLVDQDLYGVTMAMLRQDFEPRGYEVRLADFTDLAAVAAGLPGAALAVCETIANPLCKVVDVAAVAELCRDRGVPLVVDNTFATPVLCRPLALGATAVVHSVTKFLSGHSDLIAGVVCGGSETIDPLRSPAARLGSTLGPFEAWLALRGMRTVALRLRRQSANALRMAEALASLAAVERVHHPILEGSPYEALARRQLGDEGGPMLAFDLAGGRGAVQGMLDRLRLVRFAASLGGVETTISYPAITSHRSLTPAEREARGIGPGTVRVSAGIEDPADLVEDFQAALA